MRKLIIIVCFGLLGCREGEHGHSHGSHGAPLMVQQTNWTTTMESFLKYHPAYHGKKVELELLVTDLTNYKALDGKVKFEVEKSGAIIENGNIDPITPGRYTHQVKLDSGSYRLRYKISRQDKVEQSDFEFKVWSDKKNAYRAANKLQDDIGSETVQFDKAQSWATKFSVVIARVDTIFDRVKAGGRLDGATDDHALVSSPVQGIVVCDTKLFRGKQIRKGQPLLTIVGGQTVDGNLSQRYQAAATRLEKAKLDYKRKKTLLASQGISKKQLEAAKMEFELARNEYDVIAKNYRQGGVKIVSPKSGYITDISLEIGSFVGQGQRLLAVSANKELFLKAYVGQTFQSKINKITTAVFRLNDQTYRLDDLGGKLISCSKHVSSDNPKLEVIFSVPNTSNFIVGSYVDVSLLFGKGTSSVVVPSEAIMEDYGQYSLLVQLEGEAYALRPVEIGKNDGINVEILNGVEEGERVVVNGAYQVKMAKLGGKIPAHTH